MSSFDLVHFLYLPNMYARFSTAATQSPGKRKSATTSNISAKSPFWATSGSSSPRSARCSSATESPKKAATPPPISATTCSKAAKSPANSTTRARPKPSSLSPRSFVEGAFHKPPVFVTDNPPHLSGWYFFRSSMSRSFWPNSSSAATLSRSLSMPWIAWSTAA